MIEILMTLAEVIVIIFLWSGLSQFMINIAYTSRSQYTKFACLLVIFITLLLVIYAEIRLFIGLF